MYQGQRANDCNGFKNFFAKYCVDQDGIWDKSEGGVLRNIFKSFVYDVFWVLFKTVVFRLSKNTISEIIIYGMFLRVRNGYGSANLFFFQIRPGECYF